MHLLLFMLILRTVSAVYVPLQPRVDPCLEDVEDDEMVELDGITSDGTAGIGAEFEAPFFYFGNPACSKADTFAAKKQIIDGRTGTNWVLTADTGGDAGQVFAEYILDGQNIKVGSGDAAKAGAAAAEDVIGWSPWKKLPGPNTVDIANSKCNPWTIDSPSADTDAANVEWGPQVTAPMPLEALYSLMKEQLADPDDKNVLDGLSFQPQDYLIVVTQKYFQSNTNGIDASQVTDDVLGFCSLVLSYAKAARTGVNVDQSPKLFITFMPRTEFNTVYEQVKSKFKGDLFTLFNSLACYTTDDDNNVIVDTFYCSGSVSSPKANSKFAGLSYKTSAASVNIKSWIQGIGAQSPSPDLLSEFDKSIDSSIGGLTTQTEKMYDSQRSVPLFEFRDLAPKKTSEFEDFMTSADSAIQALHKTFADIPLRKKKRQAAASCFVTAGTSGTPATSTNVVPKSTATPSVVASVDPPSQASCAPNATSGYKDSHESEMENAVVLFCTEYAFNTAAKGPVKVTQTIVSNEHVVGTETVDGAYLYTGDQVESDVYEISVTSVPNSSPSGGYNLATPVPNHQCAAILESAWTQCNNQGRGGVITAGFLVYSILTKY